MGGKLVTPTPPGEQQVRDAGQLRGFSEGPSAPRKMGSRAPHSESSQRGLCTRGT